jgi:hypothetical protein
VTPVEHDVFFGMLNAGRIWEIKSAQPAGSPAIPLPLVHRQLNVAEDLQEHVRGCRLPIAECHICRLGELELKDDWSRAWEERREHEKLHPEPKPSKFEDLINWLSYGKFRIRRKFWQWFGW